MNRDKMFLVSKLFNNKEIRTVWDKEQEKYLISVVDIVSVISESKDGRKYWNKLKQRLKEEAAAKKAAEKVETPDKNAPVAIGKALPPHLL